VLQGAPAGQSFASPVVVLVTIDYLPQSMPALDWSGLRRDPRADNMAFRASMRGMMSVAAAARGELQGSSWRQSFSGTSSRLPEATRRFWWEN
jgi:hypothetical protein